MPYDYDIAEVFEAVRKAFEATAGRSSQQWVAGKVVDDHTLLVLYRHEGHDHVVGVFIDVELTAMSQESLLGDVILEVEEPSQTFIVEGVDWAEGFGLSSSEVLWRGDLPDTSGGAVKRVPPPPSYPEGAQWYIGYPPEQT